MQLLQSFFRHLRIKYFSPLEPAEEDPKPEPEAKDPPKPDPKPEPEAKDPPKPGPKPEPETKKDPPKEEDPFRILSNPLVKAEIEKRVKLAAKAAREEVEEEAKTAAERAKMEEADRLRAEKEDAEAKAKEGETKAQRAQRTAEMWRAIVDGKYAIQSESTDYIEFQVEKALESKSVETVREAVESVFKSSPFLLEAPKEPEPKPDPPTEDPEVTTSPSRKETAAPAKEKPSDPVDTFSMTRAEFQKHLQSLHGARL